MNFTISFFTMSNKYLIDPSIYLKRLKSLEINPLDIIQVDSSKQKMIYISSLGETTSYDISTALNGIGSKENSGKTPPGLHRIKAKIGDGAPPGQIFRSRKDTGEKWVGEETEDDLILTRILRLEGLEEGVNKGSDVDSFNRYIYFHGTNREDRIGTPASHGCIRMKNSDIIDLYDRVKEGTVVFIS